MRAPQIKLSCRHCCCSLENMAPLKRKRVSKKTKKSWRKNVDIKDVDNFLEDQRLEERLGIKYSEQKDEDLFQIDREGKDEVIKVTNIKTSSRPDSVSKHMRLKEVETPKCFELLEKRSAVPASIVPNTKQKILKRGVENRLLNVKKKKAIRYLEKEKEKEEKKSKGLNFYDVWSKENNDRDLNGCSEWLSNDTIRHTLHNTGKLRKQIPKSVLSKTSLLPAVETPHPGLSYNPSLKDHTDILAKVAETEVKLMKEEEHIKRVTSDMFSKVPQSKVEEQWISEMTVGLSMVKSESDEDDDGEYRTVNPPVKNKKKTLKKRRQLREAMLLKQKQKEQKIEKKKLSDIYKLRKFNEMLNKSEENTLKKMEIRKQIKEKKPYMTKVLAQTKYQEPELDFHLAEELSGNLRNVKPEGDLLYDRFKSLQKRNILQPTLKRHVKKRKVKKYERAHTKMGWEPKGYQAFEKKGSKKK